MLGSRQRSTKLKNFREFFWCPLWPYHSMLPHLQWARHSHEAYTRMGRRTKKIEIPTHLDLLGVCPSITLPPQPFLSPTLMPMLNINRIHRSQPASQLRKVAGEQKNSDVYGSCQPPMGTSLCLNVQIGRCVTRAEYVPKILSWSWDWNRCM